MHAGLDGTPSTVTSSEIAPTAITGSSQVALSVAQSGTNYQLQVDTSTVNAVTGVKITGAQSGGGVGLTAISSAQNESATIDAKGSGTLGINRTATGAVNIGSAVDKLLVNSIIVPQTKTVVWKPIVTDVTQTIFIADETYQVTAVRSVWGIASVSGTLQIEKLTSTTSPGSGTNLLTGAISLAGLANTVTAGALTGTVSNLQLVAGDRIGGVLGGTLTSLIGATVVITLIRI